jgi:hypothetical protein
MRAAIAILILAMVIPATATTLVRKPPPEPEQPICQGCPTQAQIDRLNAFQQRQWLAKPPEPAPAPPAAVPAPSPAPIPPSPAVTPATPPGPVATPLAPPPGPAAVPLADPPATQNTIATTGPVTSTTTISVGDLAGQVLTWAAAAFGSLAAAVFTAWGVRLFKLAGVEISDAARARLQEIVLNGLSNAAVNVTHDIAGKGQIEVKDAVVQQAVAYVQAHGADAIKQLGLDPNSGAAVEAIKARIATAVADPSVPTPPILNGSNPPAAKA